MRELFVPAAQARVIDTWESTGLRGTASHDYEVQDVFVPEHRTFWFQEPPSDGGPLYRMPPVAMFATFIGAVQLGIARHAIEAFVELAMAKVPTMTQIVLADRPTARTTLGKAKAMHAAAHAYLEATLLALWERVQTGHRPTLADRGDLWLAATHAGHTAHAAIDVLYTAAGAMPCTQPARSTAVCAMRERRCITCAGRRSISRPADASRWAATQWAACGRSTTVVKVEHSQLAGACHRRPWARATGRSGCVVDQMAVEPPSTAMIWPVI